MKLLALLALVLTFQTAQATWGIYKSGVSINGGYYDCEFGTAAPDFQQNFFGRFVSGGNLTLNFAEILTFKNPASDNACGGTLHYRVYRTCDSPGSFQTLSLAYCCNFGGTDCGGGACGPDLSNNGDQKWKGNSGANLLTGLTDPGVYIVEVYYSATGATGSTSTCGETDYSSNGGNNYIAYFEYENNDSFGDGDMTTSPAWTGDTGNYTVVNNSRCSGLLGTETVRTQTVRLNVASGAGTQSIATQLSTWDAQQEWYFWMGRTDVNGAQDFSSVNQQAFWLYANESTIESGTVDGYRILMGEDLTTHVRLQRVNDGVATTIFTSTAGITNSLFDYGVSFKITRSQDGLWTIFTSTLPTTSGATQSTPTALSCPEALSTVNHGTVTDNTIVPAANGYIGLQSMHSSGAAGRSAAEFDNIRFEALPPSTYFAIQGAVSSSVSEDVALAGNTAIEVAIFNPSNSVASSVQVVLLSGSAARIGGGINSNTTYGPSYTTVTLNWAANDNTSKFLYIDPDNNDLCDDMATLSFQLQSAAGGNNAYVGSPNTYTLTLVDDNMGYDQLLNADFETGTIPGWVTTGSTWTADNDAPINGTYSLHHGTQGSNGTSSIVYDLDDACLPGANTTWRFNLKFQDDCSSNNNFQVFLAANESNLYSSSVDGYAVVVDQNAAPTSGTDEFIRLYRITDNTYTSMIIGSTYEWLNNLNGGTKVGIEVVLSDNGVWTLSVDPNGDFDGLVSAGTGTDATYSEIKYFGARFKYTASQSNKMRIDDINISQKGCKQLWYSQTSGSSAANNLWSKLPSGSTEAANPGRYSRFVVQTGNTITNPGIWICQDLTINSGGTVSAGSGNMKVFGQWINNGTFTAGSGNVTFKGNVNQSILGSQTTTFKNLTIDNDGAAVTCVANVIANGVVLPQEGTLDANGVLTINSDASNTGSIGAISAGAAVTGYVNLVRYIPSIPYPYGGWVNLGCAIENQTVSNWNDDMITTGFTGSDYPSSSFNNIKNYSEPTSGSSSNGYNGVTNITNALDNELGYFVWMQGAVQTIDMLGDIQTGNITHNLSYTVTGGGGLLHDGWNLMTNPYPSEVDWNLVCANLSGPKVYYVYDRNTSSYKFRNASNNTGTASRYIPHSQSFLVKVNATSQSLSYQETFKTANGTAFERSESDQPFFAIQLSKGERVDEAIVMMTNDATADYDALDVLHLSSPEAEAVQLALVQNADQPLSMDSRPYDQELAIPVLVKMPTAGEYIITIAEDQNLPAGACLFLHDLVTGQAINILQGQSMTVQISAPFEGVRFMIRGQVPATILTSATTCANSADGVIDVVTPEGVWNVSLSADQEIYAANGSVTFDHLNAGAYTLTISNGIEGCGVNEQIIVIEEPLQVTASQTEVVRASCSGNDAMIHYTVNNSDWFAYVLRNAQGDVVREGTIEGHEMTEENLAGGQYELAIYTTCSTINQTIELSPEISFDYHWAANTLDLQTGEIFHLTTEVTGDLNFVWTINGVSYNSDNVNISFNEPGVYVANLVVNNGLCSTTEEVILTVGALQVGDLINDNSVSFVQQGNDLWISGQLAANNVQARVFDTNGRMVMTHRVGAITSTSSHIMDIKNLSNGVYQIILVDQQNIYASKKIVITK